MAGFRCGRSGAGRNGQAVLTLTSGRKFWGGRGAAAISRSSPYPDGMGPAGAPPASTDIPRTAPAATTPKSSSAEQEQKRK